MGERCFSGLADGNKIERAIDLAWWCETGRLRLAPCRAASRKLDAGDVQRGTLARRWRAARMRHGLEFPGPDAIPGGCRSSSCSTEPASNECPVTTAPKPRMVNARSMGRRKYWDESFSATDGGDIGDLGAQFVKPGAGEWS